MQQIQPLDIISVNVWQILISLVNLYLLYRIIKRFLFKPVQKILKERQDSIDARYAKAEEAAARAEESKTAWQDRLDHAAAEADTILTNASENAQRSSEAMISQAKTQAAGIVERAREEARQEKRRAEADIREELADLSTELAEKLLGREISEQDHRTMIDDFIEKLGDNGEQDQ